MCGITGFVSSQSLVADDAQAIVGRMTASLAHRGPNAVGAWVDAAGGVALGHRRLAIIDLTEAGNQPMHTRDGRWVITYNGEIYNFMELRTELEALGEKFAGGSDTEVLLVALARWGVAATLPRLNGMFAFAVWDRQQRQLWLARDRFGEKPLYYSYQDGVLYFGSELKSLVAHPSFRREIDQGSLSLFIRLNYVPAPYCIFKKVSKLRAAHLLCFTPGRPPGEPEAYWRLRDLAEHRERLDIDPESPAMVDLVDSQLRRAVRQRMVADVPLGAFLSGGIDSSAIVALMQVQSPRPIKTFTIGFWETGYNEAEDASRVARHLGTEHHELYLSSVECLDVITRLPDLYDEPFADSSQIPTTLVSEFTSRHVTVALSGDAGDEFWGGYNRYMWSKRLWPRLQRMPQGIRHRLARTIHRRSPSDWDRIFHLTNHMVPSRLRVRGGGEKLHKLAAAMEARSPDELYCSLVSQWQRPEDVLLQNGEPPYLADQIRDVPPGLHYVERMMYLDMMTYMTGDILCKVDRASMSTSLEARVPFLDNDVVKLAWNLPISSRIYKGVGKWPLRQVLKRYVPEELFNRPKMGFGIPIVDWLRGPLREWAEEMLSERRLRDGGFFNVQTVRTYWSDHLSGRRNVQHALWSVLMFEAWRKRWM
jgi:asparagine synthase (glutamine-hydrolysing)